MNDQTTRRITLALALILFAVTLVTMSAVFIKKADAAEPASYPDVAVIGDSLAAGAGSKGPSWPAQIGARNYARGGSCVVRRGCGTPTPLVDSWSEALTPGIRTLVIAGGRNDLCGSSTEDLIEAYELLRWRGNQRGVEVRFATITPAGANWPWPCEDQRVEVNAWLRSQPETIDFEKATMSQQGTLLWKYDSGDGVHLNEAGYARLAKVASAELAYITDLDPITANSKRLYVTMSDGRSTTVTPCVYEDGRRCYWLGDKMGNHRGRDFVHVFGRTFYVDFLSAAWN